MKFQTAYFRKNTKIKKKFVVPFCLLLVLSGFTFRGVAQQYEYESPGIISNIPVLYENLSTRMVYPLSRLNNINVEFTNWQMQARNQVLESLLTPPPVAPFNAKIIAEQDRGTYVARKVVFNITADSRVLAYMLVPKSAGPHPAVLLLHDHGAKFDIGKEKVIKPWDVPSAIITSSASWIKTNYGNHYIGDDLAKKGYVCLAVDMLNWSDRGGAGYEGQQAVASNLLNMGISFAGLIAHEDMRAADFLAEQPEVDPKRIAAMGWSVGGFRAWQVAALSEHIAAAVAVSWMSTHKGLMVPDANQTVGNSAFTMVHPGLASYLDYPDVASIACPKNTMFLSGSVDDLFPVETINDAFAKMHQVWDLENVGDRLVTNLYVAPHEFNLTMQKDAFTWLDTVLK